MKKIKSLDEDVLEEARKVLEVFAPPQRASEFNEAYYRRKQEEEPVPNVVPLWSSFSDVAKARIARNIEKEKQYFRGLIRMYIEGWRKA